MDVRSLHHKCKIYSQNDPLVALCLAGTKKPKAIWMYRINICCYKRHTSLYAVPPLVNDESLYSSLECSEGDRHQGMLSCKKLFKN